MLSIDFYAEENQEGQLVASLNYDLTKQETNILVRAFTEKNDIPVKSLCIRSADANLSIFLYSKCCMAPFAEIITHSAVEMSVPIVSLEYDFARENVEICMKGVHKECNEPWMLEKLVVKHQGVFISLRG